MIRRLISKLKEKIDTYMDELIECMLILVSNEPYWKREPLAQLQTATIEEPKDSNITAIIVDSEINSREGQAVPCGTTS